jgi:hypothetical protein
LAIVVSFGSLVLGCGLSTTPLGILMNPNNNSDLVSYDWWQKKRLKYNLGLIFAGILAFIFYAILLETLIPSAPEIEVTLFTIPFQGLGYLVMIGLANLFYSLGPISEKIFRPKNVNKFRIVVFNLGFWFSIILQFTIPISLIIMYL